MAPDLTAGDRIQWFERTGINTTLKSGRVIATYGGAVFFKGDNTAGPQLLPRRLVERIF